MTTHATIAPGIVKPSLPATALPVQNASQAVPNHLRDLAARNIAAASVRRPGAWTTPSWRIC